jgi:hypothetical protein
MADLSVPPWADTCSYLKSVRQSLRNCFFGHLSGEVDLIRISSGLASSADNASANPDGSFNVLSFVSRFQGIAV